MTSTPYKTSFKNLADMQDYIGKEIGLSNWFDIEQEDINTFATVTRVEPSTN